MQSFTFINHRVKAGVLQLTLVIGIIISLLCSSMILLVYYSKIAYLKQSIDDHLLENVQSAIQYGMANRKQLEFNQPITIDLFSQEQDSVTIVRRPWGVFEILSVKAWRGNHIQFATAVITALPDEKGKAVVYSPENNSPIYLVGNTTIEGNIFISERKLSTGFINGKGYARKKLISGDVQQSDREILPIDTALIHYFRGFFDDTFSSIATENYPAAAFYSFETPQPYYYYSEQSIDLSDSLSGNVIIHSAVKVRVTANAIINNVILIAPHIDIDNGFQGSIQCISSSYIRVGSECTLRYPSSLVLMGKERDSTIVLGKNTTLEGLVVMPGHDKTIGSKGIFTIQNGAILHGSAYINGQANIQGSIWGHLMARNFVAIDGSTPYASHLLNAELNSSKRSEFMPGSLLWANTDALVIAKWLK